jgi:transketolase
MMRDAFVQRLEDLAAVDSSIMLVTGDVGFRVLDAFQKRFPQQFLNVGVAEQAMISIATGLALEGRIVFAYSIANFPTLRCLEHLRNGAAYHKANVKVVSIGGGFSYGSLGPSHHATEDLAILRVLPNVTCVVPADDWEAEEATAALAAHPGPGFLRLDKSSCDRTEEPGEVFTLGKARRIRDGDDLTFIAAGGVMVEVLEAAARLEREGITCRVLSLHTISAPDRGAIRAAALETGGIMTVEEHQLSGGLGGAVAEICLEDDIRPRFFARLGIPATFMSFAGDQAYLRAACGLDAATLVERARARLGDVHLGAMRGGSAAASASS